MDLAKVMDEIALRLGVIDGLRTHEYPPGSLTPPAAVVSYPDTLTFDETYGRGMDRLSLPVVLVVGKASERSARDALGAYCNGSGARSVKAVLESGEYNEFDSVRVEGVEFDTVTIGGIDYIAAIFTLDIAGQGSG